MKLYVCWDTSMRHPLMGDHPCGIAYRALRNAGHDPEVVKAYGWEKLPDWPFNRTRGRREAERLTGSSVVPVLVTDDEETVASSGEIADWARNHPAERSTAG